MLEMLQNLLHFEFSWSMKGLTWDPSLKSDHVSPNASGWLVSNTSREKVLMPRTSIVVLCMACHRMRGCKQLMLTRHARATSDVQTCPLSIRWGCILKDHRNMSYQLSPHVSACEDASNYCSLSGLDALSLTLRRIGCLRSPAGGSWRRPWFFLWKWRSHIQSMVLNYTRCNQLNAEEEKEVNWPLTVNIFRCEISLFWWVDVVGRPKSARAPGLDCQNDLKNTQEYIIYVYLQRVFSEMLTVLGSPENRDLEFPDKAWLHIVCGLVFNSNCSKTFLSTFHRWHRMCCLELHQSVFHFFSASSSHCLKHFSCCFVQTALSSGTPKTIMHIMPLDSRMLLQCQENQFEQILHHMAVTHSVRHHTRIKLDQTIKKDMPQTPHLWVGHPLNHERHCWWARA